MRSITTRALALTCAAGAAMISISLAPAASATTEPTGAPSASSDPAITEQRQERLELVCARVPNALTRVERFTERLAGDAATRGSLLWLEEQGVRAREAGRDDLATALENRLEVRTQLADLLPGRLELLQRAQVRCDEADL